MQIIFLGPPGAGKGTQSSKLMAYLDIPLLSTGEILRNAKSQEGPQAQTIANYIDRGELVPDEMIVSMIVDTLEDPVYQKGCLFDGFPRTINQAESLDECLSKVGHPLDLVLELRVNNEELVRRLNNRANETDTPREDDQKEETVRHRLDVYDEQTRPLVEYYQARGLLVSIDGTQTMEKVFSDITKAIEHIKARKCRAGELKRGY
ncbi:MAG: adenylate kinase [Pirellulaceae bacterium]|nr:adenylate kinase [Pirellulaceae bacterium]